MGLRARSNAGDLLRAPRSPEGSISASGVFLIENLGQVNDCYRVHIDHSRQKRITAHEFFSQRCVIKGLLTH
jgi:hypothetical protein